jgi:hypothetical protein
MFTGGDYDRGVSDVGDLLELLHGASDRWQTLCCSVRSWHDTELQRLAIERRQAELGLGSSQSMIFGIAEEEPPRAEYEFTQRLWIVKRDGTRITISSETYDETELQRLADNLVRV